MDNVATLGHIEVLDVWGKPIFFEELWAGKTTVLALVRHFGCLFCQEQAASLHSALPAIEQAGASLVLLGNGNPVHASEFMRYTGLERRVFTDPARLIYKRLGMHHGLLRTYNLETTRHARRALTAGYRQYDVRGDRWQLGGVLVIEPDGKIAYRFRSEVAGDHPSTSDVLHAVKRSLERRRQEPAAKRSSDSS